MSCLSGARQSFTAESAPTLQRRQTLRKQKSQGSQPNYRKCIETIIMSLADKRSPLDATSKPLVFAHVPFRVAPRKLGFTTPPTADHVFLRQPIAAALPSQMPIMRRLPAFPQATRKLALFTISGQLVTLTSCAAEAASPSIAYPVP